MKTIIEISVDLYQLWFIIDNCRISFLNEYVRKWVDNIKMDLGEIGWDDMDWIEILE
jgi:hypothetical protein